MPQTGYLSQEPYIKHFGVGKEDILEITIKWPDQTETTIKGPISLNQLLTIKHPHFTDNSFGI